jgi:outer membrane protein TolC
MLSKQTLAALVVATLSTGCAVGPDYARPEPVLAQQFHGQAAVEQRQAASSADLAQWWTGFGDPQLSRFVALALEQNLDLAQTAARVAQARAGLGAANAALLPSGNISGQATRAYQSVETPLGRVLIPRRASTVTAMPMKSISARTGNSTCLEACAGAARQRWPNTRLRKPGRRRLG